MKPETARAQAAGAGSEGEAGRRRPFARTVDAQGGADGEAAIFLRGLDRGPDAGITVWTERGSDPEVFLTLGQVLALQHALRAAAEGEAMDVAASGVDGDGGHGAVVVAAQAGGAVSVTAVTENAATERCVLTAAQAGELDHGLRALVAWMRAPAAPTDAPLGAAAELAAVQTSGDAAARIASHGDGVRLWFEEFAIDLGRRQADVLAEIIRRVIDPTATDWPRGAGVDLDTAADWAAGIARGRTPEGRYAAVRVSTAPSGAIELRGLSSALWSPRTATLTPDGARGLLGRLDGRVGAEVDRPPGGPESA